MRHTDCGPGGTVSCTQASFAVGSSVFTLTVNVGAAVASGAVLSNTATVTSATGDRQCREQQRHGDHHCRGVGRPVGHGNGFA